MVTARDGASSGASPLAAASASLLSDLVEGRRVVVMPVRVRECDDRHLISLELRREMNGLHATFRNLQQDFATGNARLYPISARTHHELA